MATTGTLVEWLAAGVRTTAGVAAASGKVRFYQPGTLTPQSVYSDSACTSAISQPITLSAGGTSVVYTNASVRMIVKDSTDTTTLFDVTENVQRDDNTFVTSPSFNSGNETTLAAIMDAWATTGGGGSTVNWGYKQSSTATERALKSWLAEVHVSVKDFGAVGDGSNNDTTAIQAAITAVSSAGGGVVYFPPGTYLINAALTMGTSGVSLVGAGPSSSVIKNSGAATNALTATSCNGFYISDLGFSHSSSSTGAAIQLVSCGSSSGAVQVFRVSIAGHRTAISLTGTTGFTSVDHCVLATPASSGTERCVAMGNSGSYCVVTSNHMSGSGISIELTSSGSNNMFAFNNLTSSAPFAFNATYTGTNNSIANNKFGGIFSYGGLATEPAGTYIANNVGFEGISVNVASGGTVTVDRSAGPVIRIRATSTGVAYTVNAPTPTPPAGSYNTYLTMLFFNNAGGAVTGWNLNAAYHSPVAIALTDGAITTVVFKWDPDASVWRGTSGGTTT